MYKRWKVIISYKPDWMDDKILHVEELSEIETTVEHGPDWTLIDAINITLA